MTEIGDIYGQTQKRGSVCQFGDFGAEKIDALLPRNDGVGREGREIWHGVLVVRR